MVKHEAANGSKGLKARKVREFPSHFRGDYNADIFRASRYWRDRNTIILLHTRSTWQKNMVVSSAHQGGSKKLDVKARPGRGRERSVWVCKMYADLLSEFERLHGYGFRLDALSLRRLLLYIIMRDIHSQFNNGTIDERSGLNMKYHINTNWVTRFISNNKIVSRTQTGKLLLSSAKREIFGRKVAYHLGHLKRDF